jgi:hypothetical protein
VAGARWGLHAEAAISLAGDDDLRHAATVAAPQRERLTDRDQAGLSPRRNARDAGHVASSAPGSGRHLAVPSHSGPDEMGDLEGLRLGRAPVARPSPSLWQ